MAQFNIYKLPGPILVVDVQSNLMSSLESRIIVPLAPNGQRQPMKRLTPEVTLHGDQYQVMIPQMSSVLASHLGVPVGNLLDQQDAIKRAIDLVFDGF